LREGGAAASVGPEDFAIGADHLDRALDLVLMWTRAEGHCS